MNELDLSVETEKKVQILFRESVVIDYGRPILLEGMDKSVRCNNEDILKVKVSSKGKFKADLLLMDFGPHMDYKRVKRFMSEEGASPAGLPELIIFSGSLPKLPCDSFSITALRDEFIDLGVEFVPTIEGTKRKSLLQLPFRDFLIDKHTYFLGMKNIEEIKEI